MESSLAHQSGLLCVDADSVAWVSAYVIVQTLRQPSSSQYSSGMAIAPSLTMKRIVVRHTYGPLTGMHQIVGLYPDGQPIIPLLCDSWGQAALESVEPRYVIYRTQPLSSGAAPQGPAAS